MITNQLHGTSIDEIASGIYRINTPVDIPALPGGFSFNQYLIVDQKPMLFHSGLRRMFPLVREAISAVIPAETLGYVGFSHFEADESGALNEFLAIAPEAAPISSAIGALTSVIDFAERPGRGMEDGEQLSLGAHELEWIYTPHVPHGWDCGVMFDHTTKTLLCGDLFTQGGSKRPPVTTEDVVEASEQFRKPLDYFAHAQGTAAILERLASLNPKMLACMHGSAFSGDGAGMLRKLSSFVS